jgi:hypothetical protein
MPPLIFSGALYIPRYLRWVNVFLGGKCQGSFFLSIRAILQIFLKVGGKRRSAKGRPEGEAKSFQGVRNGSTKSSVRLCCFYKI